MIVLGIIRAYGVGNSDNDHKEAGFVATILSQSVTYMGRKMITFTTTGSRVGRAGSRSIEALGCAEDVSASFPVGSLWAPAPITKRVLVWS